MPSAKPPNHLQKPDDAPSPLQQPPTLLLIIVVDDSHHFFPLISWWASVTPLETPFLFRFSISFCFLPIPPLRCHCLWWSSVGRSDLGARDLDSPPSSDSLASKRDIHLRPGCPGIISPLLFIESSTIDVSGNPAYPRHRLFPVFRCVRFRFFNLTAADSSTWRLAPHETSPATTVGGAPS